MEAALAAFVIEVALVGIGLTAFQLLEPVKVLIKRHRLKLPFKNGAPNRPNQSKDWQHGGNLIVSVISN